MNSNYGRTDPWRNSGNLQTMSICCRKTGGSKVCWLGTHDRGDVDDHLSLGMRHYNIARWQQLENSIITAQATNLWQHYFDDFCSLNLG